MITKPANCICAITPEQAAHQQEVNPSDTYPMKALLDHRCPEHGEKAQPAVWGRHKELMLPVSVEEWRVLHVDTTQDGTLT